MEGIVMKRLSVLNPYLYSSPQPRHLQPYRSSFDNWSVDKLVYGRTQLLIDHGHSSTGVLVYWWSKTAVIVIQSVLMRTESLRKN